MYVQPRRNQAQTTTRATPCVSHNWRSYARPTARRFCLVKRSIKLVAGGLILFTKFDTIKFQNVKRATKILPFLIASLFTTAGDGSTSFDVPLDHLRDWTKNSSCRCREPRQRTASDSSGPQVFARSKLASIPNKVWLRRHGVALPVGVYNAIECAQ